MTRLEIFSMSSGLSAFGVAWLVTRSRNRISLLLRGSGEHNGLTRLFERRCLVGGRGLFGMSQRRPRQPGIDDVEIAEKRLDLRLGYSIMRPHFLVTAVTAPPLTVLTEARRSRLR
ncbi:hypothetical protein [Amycolatopsis sp. NPDC051061]|uniref:hypothetical protein n=1 Tax=Amycolatopsis sp. NPDC051061 TaxID=3155042 RepID=UPI003421D198